MASSGHSRNRSRSLRYDELQAAGILLQDWLADPNVRCPIAKSEVEFEHLQHWNIQEWLEGPPDNVADKVAPMDLTNDEYGYQVASMSLGADYWFGRTAPGALFIEVMYRGRNSMEPYSAQIAQAYQKDHPMTGLRYVFVVDVENEQTENFIETQLYTDRHSQLIRDQNMRFWNHGTDQYEALLGTRIGKTVVYLLLGGLERGTRRIARVATWFSPPDKGEYGVIQMRFDLEVVQ